METPDTLDPPNPFWPDEDVRSCRRIVRAPSGLETACATVAGWTVYVGLTVSSIALPWLTCPWPVAFAMSLFVVVVRPGYSPWASGIPSPNACWLPLCVSAAFSAADTTAPVPWAGSGVLAVLALWVAAWLGVYLASVVVWASLDRFEARFARTGRRTAARLMDTPNMGRWVHVLPGRYEVARYPFERVRHHLVAYAHHGRRYLAVIVVESWAGVLDRRITVHLSRDPGPHDGSRWLGTLPLPPDLRSRLEWALPLLPTQLVEVGSKPISLPSRPPIEPE